MFESVNERTDEQADAGWVPFYELTMWAFVSVELKIIKF